MYKESYKKFSKEQLDTARNIDLGEMLLKLWPKTYYEDEQGYVRSHQKKKMKIDRYRNKYFMNIECDDAIGNCIEYFDKILGYGFVRAVEFILAYANNSAQSIPNSEEIASEMDVMSDEVFEYYSKMAEDYVEDEEPCEWY